MRRKSHKNSIHCKILLKHSKNPILNFYNLFKSLFYVIKGAEVTITKIIPQTIKDFPVLCEMSERNNIAPTTIRNNPNIKNKGIKAMKISIARLNPLSNHLSIKKSGEVEEESKKNTNKKASLKFILPSTIFNLQSPPMDLTHNQTLFRSKLFTS